MPRKEVDRPSLAVDGERDFGSHVPADRREDGRDPPDELGMTLVRDAIDVAAAPPDPEVEVDLERTSDGTDCLDLQRFELASFYPGDRLLAHARTDRDIRLTHAEPDAHNSHQRPEPHVVHGRIVTSATHRRLT
jgi:hypothetical protein